MRGREDVHTHTETNDGAQHYTVRRARDMSEIITDENTKHVRTHATVNAFAGGLVHEL